MSSPLELMKRNPLFRNLRPEVLEAFIATGENRSYSAGKVLCDQGSTSDEIFLILEGSVAVKCAPAKSGEATVNVVALGPGEIVGEMSFIEQRPRSATVVAETDIKARVWKASNWRGYCEENPQVGYKLVLGISQVLCERVRRANANLAVLNKVLWGGA